MKEARNHALFLAFKNDYYKTEHTLSHVHPANMFLGIYPKELRSHVRTETCTWMLEQLYS